MRSQHGQASVEWTAAVLVVALTLGAAVAFVPLIDGRSFGAWLARHVLCALHGHCEAGDGRLAAAYGGRDAELVRRFAPNLVYEAGPPTLPVDFRQCQSHRCSDAPDDQSLDTARSSRTGTPAAAFTHVIRRGGETFVQYWFNWRVRTFFPAQRTFSSGAATR